jgi:transcriptional regulator with XRE-family HTH domain
MNTLDIEPGGGFGTMLHTTIERRGRTLKEVARDSKTTYEHIRKLIRGEAFPSKGLLNTLATLLRMVPREWDEAVGLRPGSQFCESSTQEKICWVITDLCGLGVCGLCCTWSCLQVTRARDGHH